MPKKVAVSAVPMRVLKIAPCSSLSGRSVLTYHVGCTAEGDIHLRVTQNSSSGVFDANWVPLAVIKRLILDHPAEKPMSARVLSTVYAGRSSNSCGFLFGCCLAEGLVKPGAEKDSGYVIGDIDAFKQAITALITSDIDLSAPVDVAVAADTPDTKPKRNAKGSA